MAVNVNVSVEELRIFAEYVANFKRYIDGDCADLKSAVNVLAASMDEQSITAITQTVKEIENILVDQGPALELLREKVSNYAEFVARLKSAATD